MVDLADRWLDEAPEGGPRVSRDPDGAHWFRVAAIVVSLVGAGVLLGASVRLSGGVLGAISPFVAWGLAPFGLALFGVHRTGVGVPRSVAVTLSSGFGLWVYADLLWASHLSSTAGLAFIFIPVWQTLACGVGLLLTLPWRGKREAVEQGHEPDEGRAPEEWEDP